jgi:hypothetical protein
VSQGISLRGKSEIPFKLIFDDKSLNFQPRKAGQVLCFPGRKNILD